MLGAEPVLGRAFTPEEEQSGREKVIVLSHGAWQRYFAGDPAALGRRLTFNGNTFSAGVALGEDYTVIGVMPRDFHFPDDNTQFWTPYPMVPSDPSRGYRPAMMARVAEGVPLEAAVARVRGCTPSCWERWPR
jgi:hypothetical protein